MDFTTEVIHISASAEDDKAIVTGAGAKALKVGENNYSIIITAEDGTTKEYKITIIRDEPLTMDHVEIQIDEEKSNFSKYLVIGLIGVGTLLLLIITILFIKKRKKVKESD